MPDSFDGALARLTLDPPMFRKSRAIVSTQIANLELKLHVIIAKADLASRVVFWAGLEGSRISPGAMVKNDHDHKGYFQDYIRVTMRPVKAKPGSGEPVVADDYAIISNSPPTYSGTGSFSNSVSFTFSDSFSGGFFGNQGTGSGSVSMGVSSTHSFGGSVEDFEISNTTQGATAEHHYIMSKSSGETYKEPADLIKGHKQMLGFQDFFSGAEVFDPPRAAVANLDLLSQAVWENQKTTDYPDEDLRLQVMVMCRLRDVEATRTLTNIDMNLHTHVYNTGFDVALPMSELKKHQKTFI